jgi:hypothetical protein
MVLEDNNGMKEDDWFKVIGLWSIVDFIFGVIVGLLLSRTQQKTTEQGDG